MRKSPFYVTITVNDMKEGGCSVGRTGTVTFDASNGVGSNLNEAGPISRPAGEDVPALRPGLF
jgi:hypothetical protein